MDVIAGFDARTVARWWPSMADQTNAALHVFQAADYLEAWSSSIGRARNAKIIYLSVRLSSDQELLVALALEMRRGARIIRFPDGGVADYNAPILTCGFPRLDRKQAASLWTAVAAALPAHDVAILDKMPAAVRGRPNPLHQLCTADNAGVGSVVELEGAWEDFVTTNLHRPKDSRRKRRRLAELGDVKFVVARTETEIEDIFGALERQKNRRSQETRGREFFDRPGYADYFRAMTKRFAAGGEVHLSALTCGGIVVAAHWGLVTQDRFYCLILAHEKDRFAAMSPGRLLIEDLISWSYDNGLKTFDFGIGDADWKGAFSARIAPLRRAELPRTLLGQAFVEAARIRRRAEESSKLAKLTRRIDRATPCQPSAG